MASSTDWGLVGPFVGQLLAGTRLAELRADAGSTRASRDFPAALDVAGLVGAAEELEHGLVVMHTTRGEDAVLDLELRARAQTLPVMADQLQPAAVARVRDSHDERVPIRDALDDRGAARRVPRLGQTRIPRSAGTHPRRHTSTG